MRGESEDQGRFERSEPTGRPRWRMTWLGLSVATLFAVLVLVSGTEDTADVARASKKPHPQVVTVVEVTPAPTTAMVSAFAELRPRWDAEIRAAVSGRITRVHDAARVGGRVDAGTPLFSIEKARYRMAVSAAELALEEARLALRRANAGAALARRELERSNTEAESDLVLRLPQLRVAKRAVAFAEAQLQTARRDLSDTEVRAPFSGFITERMANPGQTVGVGEPLVHLSDDLQCEITVELSEADWALLNQPIAGQRASLFRRDGTPVGDARVRSGGGFLDERTRQPRVFLDVGCSEEGVVAGDFVRVELTGRTVDDTFALPETALTRAGEVWLVDADDRLVRAEPTVLFHTKATVVIAAPDGSTRWRVAITPLASFLPGQRVTPRVDGPGS